MKSGESNKDSQLEQREDLLRALKARFEKNMNRREGLKWAEVKAKLEANIQKLWSLNEMETTGGEPDVVGHDKKQGHTFLSIVRRKVPKAARVFATTAKGWIRGKNINQEITLSIWRRWALSF